MKAFISSRLGIVWCGMFATLLYFVITWSAFTTFRGMSDWILYPVNLLVATVLVLPYFITRKVWVQIIVMVITQGVLISNLMYCRTYFTAIPLDSYMLASNLGDFTASVADSMRWSDAGFLLITILTAWLAYRRPARKPVREERLIYMGALCLLTVVTFGGIWLKGGFMKEYDRLSQSCYHSTTGAPIYTVAGHLIYQALNTHATLNDELLDDITEWKAQKEELMPYVALPDSVGRRTSLIIILCESLESWVVEKEIDGKPVTPYLNSLIADSTTFYAPNVLTQVSSGRSIDGQLLINCGLLPMLSSVYSMKHPATRYPSLNKAMKEKYGTKSYLFTCDKPITWNQEVISRSFGCDSLLDRSGWDIDELVGNPPKLSDRSFMRQSTEKLKNSDIWRKGDSRYLTFVTYSGHNPFVLPDELKDPDFKLNETAYPSRMVDYVTMAHYTDRALSTLVDYIRSRDDYANTLVVITGDHEGLAGERKELLRNPRAAEIVSPGQFTPLIILNSPIPGRYDNVLGQVDIYSTLLNLMGLDGYYWKGMGNSVFSPHKQPFAISSMTYETVGDTTGISPAILDLTRQARTVSDAMIAFDLFQ